jgi:hypothetical protein
MSKRHLLLSLWVPGFKASRLTLRHGRHRRQKAGAGRHDIADSSLLPWLRRWYTAPDLQCLDTPRVMPAMVSGEC